MGKTVEVRRGNEYLTIPEDAVDRYIAKGYDVLDAVGNVVVESIPFDTVALRAAFTKHTTEIAALKSQIATLKAELAACKSKPQAEPVKVEEPVKAAVETTVKTTSKKSKKS